ncbi:integral membrane protein family I, putative [Theileria annulata]|uniref:Integral membrane protein family I, putative n=1 Tax=Theileria annulata TaxID=5874 RepID=Q4UCA6_THEAN|nr:integral membrane protein family I, putative [Theileria annulata]CAI75545.1 integral membrane protein family I, putative [Theileria annulata]|eukprot:XP_955021.1 integral membrane protein family I, putative [Theileria annulata]
MDHLSVPINDISSSDVTPERNSKHDLEEIISKTDIKQNHGYKYKVYAFVIIALLQIFVNYDNGAVPVMLIWIQEPFNFSSTELGVMGSLPYVGYLIISPFVPYIFLKFSTKKSITISLVFNLISLSIFALAINKCMFFVSKFCIGASQALFFIYYPIWVDTFAPKYHRNLWMSIIQGGIVIGMTSGYVASSLFSFSGDWGWRYSMLTQILCELVLVVLFYFIPKEFVNFDPSRDEHLDFDLCTCNKSNLLSDLNDNFGNLHVISEYPPNLLTDSKSNLLENKIDVPEVYIDTKKTFIKDINICSDHDSETGSITTKKIRNPIFYLENFAGSSVEFNLKRCKSVDFISKVSSLGISNNIERVYSTIDSSTNKPEYSKCSKCFINNVKLYQETNNVKKLSVWSKFKLLIKQHVYILTCIAISALYFEVTGIYFWMTKIGVTHLMVKEKFVHIIFSIEIITGPVIGIISGSYLIDQIIYHYPQHPLLVDFVLILYASFALLVGIILILIQNAMTFSICIFIILFTGASMVPTLTLQSVAYLPYNLKPAGASFFMCQYQIFGFMFGTIMPGIAMDIFKNYTYSLIIIYLSGSIGLLALIWILYVKSNLIKKSSKGVKLPISNQ